MYSKPISASKAARLAATKHEPLSVNHSIVCSNRFDRTEAVLDSRENHKVAGIMLGLDTLSAGNMADSRVVTAIKRKGDAHILSRPISKPPAQIGPADRDPFVVLTLDAAGMVLQ